ncbi:MAG: hypothetical protein QM770_21515 [Tepidisphaeraceae bacterium]
MRRVLSVLCLVSAVGCSATHLPPSTAPADASASILSGLDIGRWGETYHVGDQVLLGLRSTRDGKTVTRYLLVTLTAEADRKTRVTTAFSGPDKKWVDVQLAPPTRTVLLATFDESGRPLRHARGTIFDRSLHHGLFFLHVPRAATTGPTTQAITAQVEAMTIAVNATIQFAAGTGQNPLLGDLVSTVVERPPLLEFLMKREMGIDIAKIDPADCTLAGREWPAANVFTSISIADHPALGAKVTAIPSAPPLGLVSGIVAIDGRNPSDAKQQLQVWLVAAKRGTGQALEARPIEGLQVAESKDRSTPKP